MAYTTKQGDMWDSIAFEQYGSTEYTDKLMNANQQYLGIYIFPAGITLEIPQLETADTKSASSLPPWKQVSG